MKEDKEVEKFIDENIYKALIDNSSNLVMEEPTTEWDPYYIIIIDGLDKSVYLRTKPYGIEVIKFNFVAKDKDENGKFIRVKDDKIIEELNNELNKDTFNSEFIKNNVIKLKEFLKEKKKK